MNPLSPFQAHLRPYGRMLVWGFILLVGAQAVQTIIPLILKWAIDAEKAYLDAIEAGLPPPKLLLGSPSRNLAAFAILLAALGIGQWFLNFGMRWYFTLVSRYVERDLRTTYVRHLVRLPLAFFQEQRVGDLMARATNDVEAIQRFFNHAFRMSLSGILTFVLSFGLMCTLDWKLAILALLPMPVMVWSARYMARKMRRGYGRVQEQFGAMSSRIQENLSGIRVVKAFSLRPFEIRRFGRLNDEYVDRNHHLIKLRSLFYPSMFLLNGASMVVILWLGGLRVLEGTLSLGAFVAFNAFLIRMSMPMMMLGRVVDEYQRAVASLGRIRAVLREKPQLVEAISGESSLGGDIEFRDVSFAYNGRVALQNINLHVPAGSTLAMVGRVGSGKSTLARLIPRLIQANSGTVLIDGVPVEELPIGMLRGAIGYVPQDTFLFSETVGENVSLGRDDPSGKGVKRATDLSQLTPDLAVLADGLDTLVGERGATLSGGQKQRTALARAVIRDPRILILDDAMSSVDTRTEEAILRGLREVMASRTTIIISHRISTVMRADLIIVFEDGRIVEQGDHDALVATKGIYAEMYRRQHVAQELEDL